MKNNKLKQQLQKSGADKQEAQDLASLAKQLGSLPSASLSENAQENIKGIPGLPVRQSLIPYYALGGSFALIALLIGFAESASPGTVLYDVKRGTEEIRTIVQPSYTETIVEKRHEELETLVEEQAAPERVQKAEDAYKEALERFKEKYRSRQEENSKKRREQQNRWNWRGSDNDDRRRDQ